MFCTQQSAIFKVAALAAGARGLLILGLTHTATVG
jgi:hypothetical protein